MSSTRAATSPRGAVIAGRHEPDERSVQDVPLHFWLFVAALVLNMFAGSWDRMGLPIGPDRLLFPAAFVLALLDRRTRFRPLTAVHWFMVVFTALTGFSLLFLGRIDSMSLFALADRVVMPFLLFGFAPLIVDSPLRRVILLRATALLGLYLGVTSIAETFEITALVQPGYILEAKAALAAEGTGEVPRAGGPMLAAEGNGMANAMCAMLGAHVMLRDRGAWRVAGAVAVPLGLIGAFLSMTRSVWLGAALGIVGIVLTQRSLWRWVPVAVAGGLALIVAGAVFFPRLVEIALDRGGTSRSVYDRFNTNAAALRILSENPLTGIGWAEFNRSGQAWVRQSDLYPLTSVDIEIHNVFLSRAAELGLPAAAVFVLCVVLGPLAAVARARTPYLSPWRTTLLALLCVWIVPSMLSPNPYTLPNFLLWTFSGVVFGMTARSDARTPIPTTHHTRPRR